MPKYEVTCDIASGATGQLRKGETVELDEETAKWLNDQASGALKAKAEAKAKPESEPKA